MFFSHSLHGRETQASGELAKFIHVVEYISMPHLHRSEEQRDKGDKQRHFAVGFGDDVEELV